MSLVSDSSGKGTQPFSSVAVLSLEGFRCRHRHRKQNVVMWPWLSRWRSVEDGGEVSSAEIPEAVANMRPLHPCAVRADADAFRLHLITILLRPIQVPLPNLPFVPSSRLLPHLPA